MGTEVILHLFYSHLDPSPYRTIPVEKRDAGNENLSLSFPILDPKQGKTSELGSATANGSLKECVPNFLSLSV